MRFIWPIASPVITRNFHYLSSLYVGGQHAAVDLIPRDRPATGEPIMAVADWEVVGVGWDFYSGFFVALDHAGGWRSFYRHLYGQSPVKVGQRGKQGDTIGNIGNTGWSLGAHLHFDLWNCIQFYDSTAFYKGGWWAHDPELYLGQEEDMNQAEFNKMFAQAVKDAMVYAYNETTKKPVGSPHSVGAYLHQIRRIQEQVNQLKKGSAAYTDARAVQAVKNKLG